MLAFCKRGTDFQNKFERSNMLIYNKKKINPLPDDHIHQIIYKIICIMNRYWNCWFLVPKIYYTMFSFKVFKNHMLLFIRFIQRKERKQTFRQKNFASLEICWIFSLRRQKTSDFCNIAGIFFFIIIFFFFFFFF